VEFLRKLLLALIPRSEDPDAQEARRLLEGASDKQSWFFTLFVLVLVGAGLFWWLTGVDTNLDVRGLATIAVVAALVIGLFAIIGTLRKYLVSDSGDDERPPALQGNTGCLAVILIVTGLIGFLVLISR
jgi:hypothetical protein